MTERSRLALMRGAHHLRRLAAAGAVCLGVLFSAPVAAHAGNYPVYECYPGLNSGFPDLQGAGYDNNRIVFALDCSDGQFWHGALLKANGPSSSDITGSLWIDAPAGTRFHTVRFFSFMGPTDSFGGPSRYWGGQDVIGTGWHLDFQPYPNYYRSTVTQQDATRVSWQVTCAASWNGAGSCVHEEGSWIDHNAVGDFYAEVLDYTAPQLSISGSAFDQQVVAGRATVDVSGTDQGSGVRSAWVDVNGSRYADVATNCPGIASGGGSATQLRPCTNLSRSVTLDTAYAPFHDGANTVKVCVADYATLQGTTPNADCEERTLTVDNSCTDSQGAQQGLASSLSAGFENAGGSHSRGLVVYSTKGAKLTGGLRGSSGGPVGGASICLYEQIDAPAEIRQLAQVTKTRSDGSYTLLVPSGPSRLYDVAYRSNDHSLEQRGLTLNSIVVPSLVVGPNTHAAQASARRGGVIRNGQAGRFSGQIPGPYAADRVVALQALIGRSCGKAKRGRHSAAARSRRCRNKWRTFKTLRTNASGRYSGIYRFTQTTGKVRYSFRAMVPLQAGYPYRSGSSDVRHMTVRG